MCKRRKPPKTSCTTQTGLSKSRNSKEGCRWALLGRIYTPSGRFTRSEKKNVRGKRAPCNLNISPTGCSSSQLHSKGWFTSIFLLVSHTKGCFSVPHTMIQNQLENSRGSLHQINQNPLIQPKSTKCKTNIKKQCILNKV